MVTIGHSWSSQQAEAGGGGVGARGDALTPESALGHSWSLLVILGRRSKLKRAAEESAHAEKLRTNEAIMRAKLEAEAKVNEVKKKLAESVKEIGEKVLEAGKVAGQVTKCTHNQSNRR